MMLEFDLRFLPENRLFCSVDNVILNAGSGGSTLAADDIGGIFHQRVKVQFGADGSATDVSTTNPLPVVPQTEIAGVGIGAAADAEAAGNGSIIALLKRLRTIIAAGLPAALVGGRLDVNVGNVASVLVPGGASLFSAQQAVTATAAALGANACRAVTVRALMGNVIPVFIGPTGVTTTTGYELAPNQSVVLNVSNANLLFVIASTTGASICFIGHP